MDAVGALACRETLVFTAETIVEVLADPVDGAIEVAQDTLLLLPAPQTVGRLDALSAGDTLSAVALDCEHLLVVQVIDLLHPLPRLLLRLVFVQVKSHMNYVSFYVLVAFVKVSHALP